MVKKYIRRIYDWTLSWAKTPYGPIFLLILSFSESSFFPIPPDILLIALCLGARRKALYFSLICSIGSILGGIFGYGVGHFLWWEGEQYSYLANTFFKHVPGFTEVVFQTIRQKYNEYGFMIIFTAGFTPIPYKIFTISSGAFGIDLGLFILASTVSRSARFFIVGLLIWKYGQPISDFIDKYFNILTLIFTVLLVGGFFIIKFIV